jgi:hypothetical protein
MADEPFALSTVPPALPAQGDYDAICATVMESARGRWFLQEYARRNRNADTRVVLDAIERIEAVIRGDRGREAYLSFRSELLEMATTIAQTRAEVAEFPPARLGQAEAVAAAREVFAAAERIHEVAWTMRERGLDPSTCDQIEALSVSILSASSLRDPNNGRAHMLGEVLRYLERRINAMLESCAASAPAASEANGAAGNVHAAPAGNGHDAFAPDAAAPLSEPQAAAPAFPELAEAKDETGAAAAPVKPFVEPSSAETPLQLETEPLAFVGKLPAAVGPTGSTEPQSEPAAAQVETIELELAPLTVVPIARDTADAIPPAAELEHAPIIVEAAFAPTANDAPAAEAEAASAQDLPATYLMPEPVLAALAQPDPAPAAAADRPPAEMAALEVAPLIATPAAPPVRDDAPPVDIELDPIAVEVARPEPTPEAAPSAAKPALELAGAPEDAPSPATPTVPPAEVAAPAAAADPQPTAIATASELVASTPEPAAGGSAPSGAPAMTSIEATEAAPAAAPIVVEQAIGASSAEPIAASAPAVLLPEEEVAPSPAAAVGELPARLVGPAIEGPPGVEVEPAVVAPTTPWPGLPAESQSGAGAPEPALSVEQPAPVNEPLIVPLAVDSAMAQQPVATEAGRPHAEPPAPTASTAPTESMTSNAASASPEPPAAPAPDVTTPPAEPEAAAYQPESAELADFLLEPLPLPAVGGAATRPESGLGAESRTAPFDPMAEIEEELFAATPQAASVVVPPAFDPAATLRPSAPMPTPGAAVPAAGRTPLVAPAAPAVPQPTPGDPLAALKAMTDEERIALFT